MRIDLREFFRRIFTIPSARRQALRELLQQEVRRLADYLVDCLVEDVLHRPPLIDVEDRLVQSARRWVDQRGGKHGQLLRYLFPVLEAAIRQQAQRVDETLERRLREAAADALQRILK